MVDLEEAAALAEALRAIPHLAAVQGALSLAYAGVGRLDAAAAALERSRALLAQLPDFRMSPLAEAYAWAAALLDGSDAEARRGARDWFGRLSPDPVPEVRLALRVLNAALLGADVRARTWRVHVHGQWFQPPAEAVVSLLTRKPLAALVAALAEARIRTPGAAVSAAALFEAGWPGTRLPARSAANRLHVSLNELRRAGLKPLLLRSRAGYMLDPGVPVEWLADA